MPAGIIALVFLLFLLLLWPFILVNFMVAALYKLGISPATGLMIITAMLLGSLLNIPIKRFRHNQNIGTGAMPLYGIKRWLPVIKPNEMIVAVNVGGAVIPALLVVYQLLRLMSEGALLPAMLAILINVILCYSISQVRPGIGILMPALYPGVIAALSGLLLYPENPAAVAFCAGIMGPLLGADLLHLRQFTHQGLGMASIGGAGTFDGIVLSGFIALLLS